MNYHHPIPPAPEPTGFTIYTKEGCKYCDKVKLLLLKDTTVRIVSCDEWLTSNEKKETFLEWVKGQKGVPPAGYKTFPMVFFGGVFLGGYDETFRYWMNNQVVVDSNDF